MNKPKLRPVELLPFDHKGTPSLLLRDPLQLRPGAVAVARQVGPILLALDGRHSMPEIQRAFTEATGAPLDRADLESFLGQLDEALLLEGKRYEAERARVEAEFRAAGFRRPAHAGTAYPADPAAYREAMAEHLGSEEKNPAICAVITPHIDFERGAPVYGRAFGRVPLDRFARVVMLGTSHHGDLLYAVTDKDHDTPFGRLPVDRDFLSALERRHGGDLRAGEVFHRNEHSIELNTALLHLLAGDPGIPLVPILCGSFHDIVARGGSPGEVDEVRRLLEALHETLAASSGDTLLVAAADLSHMGPRFGDPPLGPEERARLESEDRASMERAAAADAEGFHRSIAADADRRKVCGLPPIYALLSLLPGARGTLQDYRQCPDPQPGSFVSIAAMTFARG